MNTKDMEQIFRRLTSALILLFARRDEGKGHNTSVGTKIQTWTSSICGRHEIGLTLTICAVSAKLLKCGRGRLGSVTRSEQESTHLNRDGKVFNLLK